MKVKRSIVDKGFLIEKPELSNHPWILGLQGSPYEIGYQHGYLLADVIQPSASGFLSPIYARLGGWQPEKGRPPTLSQMDAGQKILSRTYYGVFEPVIQKQAPEFLQEMSGIADGLAAAGAVVPRQDIFIGNCIPEITEQQFYLPESDTGSTTAAAPPKGCSDCIVWGKATRDRRLIHGSNYDYSTFNVLHKAIGVTVVKPESGHAFMAQCLAGTVGHYRGMNVEGITAGELTSDSADRDIQSNPRIPHAMHMRKIIQYASSTRDAISLMQQHGGTTGYNHAVGDAKVPTAVDIEAACNQMAVIYPREEVDALWSTNQFVAYPGFNGYAGVNLAKNQVRFWEIPWEQADTVEKWRNAVRAHSQKHTFSWQRYEKIEGFIEENYGQMDVQLMINLLGQFPLCRKPDSKIQLSAKCEQLYGLSGPILDQRLASVFSVVFDGGNSTAWVAVGEEPAQSGRYWPIGLFEYLKLLEN